MRAISNAILLSMLLASLALTGCSYGGSSSASNPNERGANSHTIALTSPAFTGKAALPARYTCDGKNVPPPLKWANVPANAKELTLMLISLTPVRQEGNRIRERVTVSWAVTGLPPTLHGLTAGRLPHGAVIGRTARGGAKYSVCPPKGKGQTYLLTLYASPQRLGLHRNFSAESLFANLTEAEAPNGQLFVTYSRA